MLPADLEFKQEIAIPKNETKANPTPADAHATIIETSKIYELIDKNKQLEARLKDSEKCLKLQAEEYQKQLHTRHEDYLQAERERKAACVVSHELRARLEIIFTMSRAIGQAAGPTRFLG